MPGAPFARTSEVPSLQSPEPIDRSDEEEFHQADGVVETVGQYGCPEAISEPGPEHAEEDPVQERHHDADDPLLQMSYSEEGRGYEDRCDQAAPPGPEQILCPQLQIATIDDLLT